MKNKINMIVLLFVCMVQYVGLSQTKTTLLYNGSNASKFDIVFMGDGFSSSNQSEYNTLVANYFKAMFTHDNGNLDNVLSELQDAFNVYRVNMNSVQSGVTQYECESDDSCPSTAASNRNTAFNFRYSGCWNCCWMTKSGNTDSKINNALSSVGLSGAEYVVMILNESGFGGCSYGKVLSITKTTSNNTLLHELGHSVGKLADEYERPGCQGASNPTAVNVDKNPNPSKWNKFARNTITTGSPSEYNVDGFEGARYKQECIYRASSNSTMRNNTNLFNPPSYNEFWKRNKSKSKYNFEKVIVGNFQGNSYSDVLLHYGNYIAAYPTEQPKGFTGSGVSTRPANSYITTKKVKGPGGTWYVSNKDRFYVGDFTGDGYDDLLVFYPNGKYSRLGILKSVPDGFECVRKVYYNLTGWQMRDGDQFHIADLNGDGKDDFYVFNATNWNQGYMGMFRSTGNNFSYVKRYDKYLPGHFMSSGDKYHVADLNGDNKEELVLFNKNSKVTRLFKSSGNTLSLSEEYFASLPGWTSKAGDKYYIADINGDGKDDVYVFNGTNWGPEYLLMLRSDGSKYNYIRRYDNNLPGWNMNNRDKFYVADIDGNGKEDLYVFNNQDWSTQYLGRVITSGSTVSVTHQNGWIGGWNLGASDKLLVDNRDSGRDHLFIHNKNWFGYMWSGSSNMYIKGMYKDYIHAFKHHDYGWY